MTLFAQNKTYIYKHYSQGVFIGLLEPYNPLYFSTAINTAASELILDLPIDIEAINATIETENLITDDDEEIVTKTGDAIIFDSTNIITGVPGLSDDIEVWEYSTDYPNGIRIYNGLVSGWSADYSDNTVSITNLSYGIQLDNYLVQILPQSVVAEQLLEDSEYTVYGPAKPLYDRLTAVNQTFTVGVDTDIEGVYLNIRRKPGGPTGSITARLSIIEGLPTSPSATLVTRDVVVSDEDLDLVFFQFTSAVDLIGGANYHISITNPNGSNYSATNLLGVAYNSTSNYPDGQVYLENETSGFTTPGTDIYFQIVSLSGAAGNNFTSVDPSAIVRELLDTLTALGGKLTYTETSIANTGLTVSYKFKFNTLYEALNKCVELAPANWYFYIDPGTNVVYFQPKPSAKTLSFTRGKVIGPVIGQTLEDLKNKVYFSGGITDAGTNLLVNNSKENSITQYGQWLQLPTDNRVTVLDTANSVVSAILNEKSRPRFAAKKVTVVDNQYDLNSFVPGDLVGFNGYNDIVNNLELQIMSKNRFDDRAFVMLEVLPPTPASRVEELKRNLLQQQTENNPDLGT